MKREGLKSSVLADEIGVNRSTISHVISGRNKPSIDFLKKLLYKYPHINANWLITGLGSMNDNIDSKSIHDIRKIGKVVVFYDDNSFEEINKDSL